MQFLFITVHILWKEKVQRIKENDSKIMQFIMENLCLKSAMIYDKIGFNIMKVGYISHKFIAKRYIDWFC